MTSTEFGRGSHRIHECSANEPVRHRTSARRSRPGSKIPRSRTSPLVGSGEAPLEWRDRRRTRSVRTIGTTETGSTAQSPREEDEPRAADSLSRWAPQYRGKGPHGQSGPAGCKRRNLLSLRVFWLTCGILAAFPLHSWGAPEVARLRVGTSGDYAPFSSLSDSGRRGFDVTLAKAYARERGRPLEWVSFTWPELSADLLAGRFDVAMSGVTVRPERSAVGRFSLPVAESGAVVLAPRGAYDDLDALDRPSVRIAVNQGGHLERVTRARFSKARVLTMTQNRAVPEMLDSGDADAIVTDTLEAPHWLERRPHLARLGPFTRDRKALWLAPGNVELARDLDGWLLEKEQDGSLGRWRREHLGAGAGSATALALPALLAAVDERLAVMPLVAAEKSALAAPVEVPAVEERVIAAGLRAVEQACADAGRAKPDPGAVRQLYRALIEAAKSVQHRTLRDGSAARLDRLDLDRVLRPALIRIGERIAWLVARLPDRLEPAAVETATRSALAGRAIDVADLNAISAGIVAVAARSPAAPSTPAPSTTP